MTAPSAIETQALDDAWLMLRFAAIGRDDLDPRLGAAVAAAAAAAAAGGWTTETSGAFWATYTTLSSLIKPSTIDCLRTQEKKTPYIRLSRFWRGRAQTRTLGEKTSHYYTALLVTLIVLTAALQFYTVFCGGLVDKINATYKAEQDNFSKITADYNTLGAQTAGLDPKNWTVAENQLAQQIIEESDRIGEDADTMLDYKQSLDAINEAGPAGQSGMLTPPMRITLYRPDDKAPYGEWYRAATSNVNAARLVVNQVGDNSQWVLTAISVFLLPILYAAIGSTAFILRLISDQLKTSTFSSNAPIRNAVRFSLGIMMGLIVGAFADLTSQLSLQPLAIAFLAGYGVEAFLAVFDDLIGRFARPKEK